MSNTSPISSLAIIGRLDLLQSQFTEVLIPNAVQAELERMPDPVAKEAIERALEAGWLRRRAVENPRLAAALGNNLDPGEAEAIALAAEALPDVILVDEQEGRAVARQAGLAVRGVLGVLIRAKAIGEVGSVAVEIAALRSRAGFFITASLEAEVLRSVEERPGR